MKKLHFKSKEAYRKWQAYKHIRTKTGKMAAGKLGRKTIAIAEPTKGQIFIAGHVHKVRHYRR